MNLKKQKLFLILSIVVVISTIQAQNVNNLEKARKEIEQLQIELKEKEVQEKSLFEQREDIDREIGLQRKLIIELEDVRNQNEQRIRNTEILLEKTNTSFKRLKELIAQRMVSVYKQGQIKDWEILLSLNSLNQAIVWLKYNQRIAENDSRNLQLLFKKEEQIEIQKNELENNLIQQNRLIEEKTVETNKLEDRKKSREKMLVSVRADIKDDREMLENKKRALADIQGRINQEEERKRTSATSIEGTAFASLMGKLPWPVNGKITSKYGRRQHPTLNVIEDNLGIEIQTSERGPVRAVGSGEINWTIWRRGMGNIVIIDHGGGYYTVYAFLEVVLVNIGDIVEEGEIIGHVGDRQNLNGSTLHFEVWNGNTSYNPELWLRKS